MVTTHKISNISILVIGKNVKPEHQPAMQPAKHLPSDHNVNNLHHGSDSRGGGGGGVGRVTARQSQPHLHACKCPKR